MANSTGSVLLEACGISKTFPGVRALDGMHLVIRRGVVTALVGENGAGKSTLMNILSGVFPPDGGEIRIDGRTVTLGNTRQARELGIAIVHQELHLISDMSVAENIFLGREPKDRLGLIDFARMRMDAVALLRRLHLDRDPRTLVRNLRVGEQQVVEIAKALSLHARVLFMDEPTSAISDSEAEVLFDIIETLKSEGVGIVFVTHKMDEVFQICDFVSVLRDGTLVGESPLSETTHDRIVAMMVGRELGSLDKNHVPENLERVLSVEHLSSHAGRVSDGPFLEDISLQLRRGEVVGVFGLMGAGRTELLETIFGVHPLVGGSISIEGQKIRLRSPRDALEAGIGLAPEDRKTSGLVMSMSVAANVSLATIGLIKRFGLINAALESDLAARYVERLRITVPDVSQEVSTLSGENQQKVVLAKWLARKPKVLLLDEPTRGIDVNAKREIYSVIRALTDEGVGILAVSSELPEILAISDRILVMSEGRLTGEFSAAEANEKSLLNAALPAGV